MLTCQLPADSYGLQSHSSPVYKSKWEALGHLLVRCDKKLCFMCQAHKRKLRAGWFVYTRKKCEKCNIPLCKQGMGFNCYEMFHQLYFHEDGSPKPSLVQSSGVHRISASSVRPSNQMTPDKQTSLIYSTFQVPHSTPNPLEGGKNTRLLSDLSPLPHQYGRQVERNVINERYFDEDFTRHMEHIVSNVIPVQGNYNTDKRDDDIEQQRSDILSFENTKTINLNESGIQIPTESNWSSVQPQHGQVVPSKVVVNNPSFWSIPLKSFMGSKQEDFTGSLNNFTLLPQSTEDYKIPAEIILHALNTCELQRHKFAVAIFRQIISIGEAHGRNITGKVFVPNVIKGKISPVKLQAIQFVCRQYYPSKCGEEEKDWKIVVSALHKALWTVEKFVQNFLDISPIANMQGMA
ncbi:unnamed protein product [Mytilus edulis]|uniref:Uncharacterized protein n=1 Tax=Mytilus edulis TaxID=6550 RepID=A0A8S3UYT1_MYTED|nr:unnamed protein product [Mytilus edulis]